MADDTSIASDLSSAMTDTSASSAPEPVSEAPVDHNALMGGATTQPALPATSPSTSPKKGPIPFDTHETALKNAREKAVKEEAAKWAWANQFKDAFTKDPWGTLQREAQFLLQHPTYGPQIQQSLSQFKSNRPASAKTLPVLQLENGTTVDLNQLREDWMASARQEYSPAIEAARRLQEVERHAEAEQAAHQRAGVTVSKLEKLPHFADLKHDIRQRLSEADLDSDHPDAVAFAALEIYQQLYNERIAPNQVSRQAVLNDITRQASASTVNPRNPSAHAKKSIRDADSTADALRIAIEQQVGR